MSIYHLTDTFTNAFKKELYDLRTHFPLHDTCVSSTYSYPPVFRSLSLAIALQMKELYVALHTIG